MKKLKIAVATTQSLHGSTMIGRVLSLVEEFQKMGHECHVLALRGGSLSTADKIIHFVGNEPFRRTETGKERLHGLSLVLNMLGTALKTAWALQRLKLDVVIISKPLPANTLGVWLSTRIRKPTVVLDADDFELTANKLSSITQRAVIHWSERLAARLAGTIVVASPFLADHFKQLTQNTKPIAIIPTGIAAAGGAAGAHRPLEQRHHRVGVQRRQDPQPLLIYIGSVSVSSGHRVDLLPDILEKVVAVYPAAHILIAGDGDDVTSLKEEFHRRQLEQHVTWHGRFTLSQVEGFLQVNSIIIDPVDDSIANRAKSSFRVLVAAAAGVPVVTSNIGIRPELVPMEFHARFFADPASPASYAAKITELVQHPLTDMERTALANHAAPYTWPQLAAHYCEILTV